MRTANKKGNDFVNTNLLLSKMALRGYTKTSLAEAVGISRSTVTNIFNRNITIDNTLVAKIYDTLELTPEEATEIFFKPNLRITKVLKGKQLS